MNIDNITSDSMSLTYNGKAMLIKVYEQEIERLNKIIKDIKSQLDYLETYSSKEDVFEDMKRRLDRIDKIIGRDKEC